MAKRTLETIRQEHTDYCSSFNTATPEKRSDIMAKIKECEASYQAMALKKQYREIPDVVELARRAKYSYISHKEKKNDANEVISVTVSSSSDYMNVWSYRDFHDLDQTWKPLFEELGYRAWMHIMVKELSATVAEIRKDNTKDIQIVNEYCDELEAHLADNDKPNPISKSSITEAVREIANLLVPEGVKFVVTPADATGMVLKAMKVDKKELRKFKFEPNKDYYDALIDTLNRLVVGGRWSCTATPSSYTPTRLNGSSEDEDAPAAPTTPAAPAPEAAPVAPAAPAPEAAPAAPEAK